MTELAFYGIALPLVVSTLPLRFGNKFWIILRATKTRTTQPNAVALAERSIGESPIDLISTDHFWVVTVAAAIGSRLRLQAFSFIVGVIAQMIQECKADACHRNRDLGPELNIAPRLAVHDRPDMGLVQTDDPVGNTPAIRVIENALLANAFTHHQQFLIPVTTCHKQACPTCDQGIDADQVALQMAELLFDRPADLADARALLLGHAKGLLPSLLAVCSRLWAKGLSDLRMHRVNQRLVDFTCLIEKRWIGWMPNIGRSTGRIDQQGTLMAHHLCCLHRFMICAVRATVLVIIRLLGYLRLDNGKADRTIRSLQSLITASGRRLRKYTIIDGSNGAAS